MNKKDCFAHLIKAPPKEPFKKYGSGRAPMNIALIKYWGKRDPDLNLPITSSLSLSVNLYTTTQIELVPSSQKDSASLELNHLCVPESSAFYQRLIQFLEYVRPPDHQFHISTINDMPTAAGLASSASGFAALVLALDDLFSWHLPKQTLSILARLGSGSACRSIFPGFVRWEKGVRDDGLDSFAVPLTETWPSLCMAFVPISFDQKPISSSRAMQQTVATSPLYRAWPAVVDTHLLSAETAIQQKDFTTLGSIAEQNALAMHASMLTSQSPILYWLPKTIEVLHRVWKTRKDGLEVYVTMDAGPNVKLLFLEKDRTALFEIFPEAHMLT